jgi:hypothetical protein
MTNYEGGNIDLRVPYVGYSSESESYKAAGTSAYNALQTHIEKRMSHGVRLGFSYTYSHATDDRAAQYLPAILAKASRHFSSQDDQANGAHVPAI